MGKKLNGINKKFVYKTFLNSILSILFLKIKRSDPPKESPNITKDTTKKAK
jgi:hypothetical protein